MQAAIAYAAKHMIQPRFNALNFHKVIVFHTTSPPCKIRIISIIWYDMVYGEDKITNKINSRVCTCNVVSPRSHQSNVMLSGDIMDENINFHNV